MGAHFSSIQQNSWEREQKSPGKSGRAKWRSLPSKFLIRVHLPHVGPRHMLGQDTINPGVKRNSNKASGCGASDPQSAGSLHTRYGLVTWALSRHWNAIKGGALTRGAVAWKTSKLPTKVLTGLKRFKQLDCCYLSWPIPNVSPGFVALMIMLGAPPCTNAFPCEGCRNWLLARRTLLSVQIAALVRWKWGRDHEFII